MGVWYFYFFFPVGIKERKETSRQFWEISKCVLSEPFSLILFSFFIYVGFLKNCSFKSVFFLETNGIILNRGVV